MTDYEKLAKTIAFGQPGAGTEALGIATPGIQARSGYSKSMNDWAMNRMRRSGEQKRRMDELRKKAMEEEDNAGFFDYLGLALGGASAYKGMKDRKKYMDYMGGY
jgi:hypothetical protein